MKNAQRRKAQRRLQAASKRLMRDFAGTYRKLARG